MSYTSTSNQEKSSCRTCLSVRSLNPIFAITQYNEKYTEIIFETVGIKIEFDDPLPKGMCSICINTINSIYKFRKLCKQVERELLNQIQNKQSLDSLKEEKYCDLLVKDISTCSIDISDLIETNNIKLESERVSEAGDNNDAVDNNVVGDINEAGDNNVASDSNDIGDIKEAGDNNIVITQSCDFQSNDDMKIASDAIIEIEISKIEPSNKPETVKAPKKPRKRTTNLSKIRKVIKKVKSESKKEKLESKKENKKETNKIDNEKVEIECEYCHKILTSRHSVKGHYKIHTGFDVVCEHCGKKFISRRRLLMHCRAKHGYEKTDKCSYCDYTASNGELVKIHERLHTGEKPYACSDCGHRFHRKSSYLQHVAIHLPEKTVLCDECPARFKSVTLMRIHKTRHRKPRYTFRCKLCDNFFSRRRNATRHLERIHNVTPDPEQIERQTIATE